MPALTSIALGSAGAFGGAIAGGSDDVTTSSVKFAPPTAEELALRADSKKNYNLQQGLVDQQQAGLAGADQFQGKAQGTIGGILDGSGFNITPQQQAQIESIRRASIDAGQGDIQNFTNQNLSNVSSDAANRGLRGQALSELQGRAIGEGTRQMSNLVGQANQTAAQQSLDSPFRQAQLQAGTAQNNVSYGDNLRQQAVQNRQQLQNPALMNSLQQERMGAATTTKTEEGNLGKAIGGAMGGLGGGIGAASGIQKLTAGYAHGGKVGGAASIRGDHPSNDTVPAMLSPGEIVIPRSFAHDPKLSKAFIDYLHNQKKNTEKAGS